VSICRNATTKRAASSHVSLSPLPRQCGARWAAHHSHTEEEEAGRALLAAERAQAKALSAFVDPFLAYWAVWVRTFTLGDMFTNAVMIIILSDP
jgi:DUF917 family protein